MSRHQFERYLDQVFDFFSRIAALPDGRCYAKHHAKKILEAVFFGSACQFGPLHRIETECCQGALRRRIGGLSEDAIGYTLERQDPHAIFALGCAIARQLKRNLVFAPLGLVAWWSPPWMASRSATPLAAVAPAAWNEE